MEFNLPDRTDGYWLVSGNLRLYAQYRPKPLHRWMMYWLLGWEWVEDPTLFD